MIDTCFAGNKDDVRDDIDEKESGIESESDSGNETISSENVDFSSSGFHELLGSSAMDFSRINEEQSAAIASDMNADIEAFIARVAVPPPPRDSPEPPMEEGNRVIVGDDRGIVGDNRGNADQKIVQGEMSSEGSISGDLSANPQKHSPKQEDGAVAAKSETPFMINSPPLSLNRDVKDSWQSCQLLDEEIARLVIPPPPVSDSPTLEDIPIVPPVDVKSPSPISESSSPSHSESSPLSIKRSPPNFQKSPTHSERSPSLSDDSPPNRNGVKLTRSHQLYDIAHVDRSPPSGAGNTMQNVSMAGPPQRPCIPPPIPPIEHQRSNSVPCDMTVTKPKPPVPPKRLSSLESPSGVRLGSSAPASPTTQSLDGGIGNQESRSMETSPHKMPLWRPTAVSQSTRTVDDIAMNTNGVMKSVSELYANKLVNTMGTLPRQKGAQKTPPPPPPPRRSSMVTPQQSTSNVTIKSSTAGDLSLRYAGALDAVKRNYKNIFQAPTQSDLATGGAGGSQFVDNGVVSSAKSVSSPGHGTICTEQFTQKKSEPEREKAKSNTHRPLTKTNSAPTGTVTAMVEKIHSQESVECDPAKMKLKAYISPTIQRRQVEYLENACREPVSTPGDYIYVGSPKVGRSQTFNTDTPKGSPQVHRHSSFTKGGERSPSPFRTFLGDQHAQLAVENSDEPSSLLYSPSLSLAMAKAALRPIGGTTENQVGYHWICIKNCYMLNIRILILYLFASIDGTTAARLTLSGHDN